jgi:hypothetical protein
MRLAMKLAHAVAIAGMLCGLAATPALADYDHYYDRSRGHRSHHGDWDRSHHHYDYDHHYYYYRDPYVDYYAAPRVYVPLPPPPPSIGLNLVFPFHHH